MEALLLYRIGSNCATLKEGLKLEGVRIRELVWSPTLNIEELVWGVKTVCIMMDQDKSMLSVGEQIKNVFPEALIFIFENNASEFTREFSDKHSFKGVFAAPWNFIKIGHDMKIQLLNEGESSTKGFILGETFALDADKRCLFASGDLIQLRNKEYELLEFLMLHKGRLVTRTALIEHVWDRNAKISSNTLDVHIGRLRKKIECPFKTKFIHTVHSIGYRFEC